MPGQVSDGGDLPVQNCLSTHAFCPLPHLTSCQCSLKMDLVATGPLVLCPVLLLRANCCSTSCYCLSPSLTYWDRWPTLAGRGLHSPSFCPKNSDSIPIQPTLGYHLLCHSTSLEDSFSHKYLVCRCSSPLRKIKYFQRTIHFFPYVQVIYRWFIIVQYTINTVILSYAVHKSVLLGNDNNTCTSILPKWMTEECHCLNKHLFRTP